MLPLLAVSLGYFMVILDATIVTVALPALGGDLHAGVAGLQRVVDAYAVAFAGLLLLGGTLSDRFGSRGVFPLALAAFTLASAACGLAPPLGAARVAQGSAPRWPGSRCSPKPWPCWSPRRCRDA